MSTGTPPPQYDGYYVTNADLAKSRAAPEANSLFDMLAASRLTRVVAVIGYLIFMAVSWGFVERQYPFTPNEPAGLIFGVITSLPYFVMIFIRAISAEQRTGISFWRDIVFIRDFTQVAFLFVIAFAAFVLMSNFFDNLAESDLRINFNVLARTNGVEISEGPDPEADLLWLQNIPLVGEAMYTAEMLQPGTNARALIVGLINTLRVVSISLVFATLLGVLLGIGLLSNNWLVRKTSSGYVEIFRNTPLLLQLFFIYRGILGFLPARPADAIELAPNIFLSGRGLNYPAVVPTATWDLFLVAVLASIGVGLYGWRRRTQLMEQTGQPGRGALYFAGSVGVGLMVGWVAALIAGGAPLTTELPELGRFRFTGGATISAEFLALALGLVLYTSAFIADIVRAGIQSVPMGQIEAAYAHGLTRTQTLQLVILPQALRLIIPPMTNQYLNLTKNSSLAIAIGFWDVYNVANIIQNQTGQAVALFAVLMVTYLMLSLIISLVMNAFNQSRQYKTR